MKISINELAALTGSNLIQPQSGDSIVSIPLTDSRSLTDASQSIFFALRTPGNDGHLFIENLYQKGVRAFVVNEMPQSLKDSDAAIIQSDNVAEILTASGRISRDRAHCPVIGITGSQGKTVIKEMLNAMLYDEFNIARSPRSWNSQIGVPQSLWLIDDDTQLAIIEAGISKPGEMDKLADIIRPTIGIFTSLTDEHSQAFDSPEQKCQEKAKLFKTCDHIIYPNDDKVIGDTLTALYPSERLHAVSDGAQGICLEIARLLGVDTEKAKKRLADSESFSARIDITDTPNNVAIAYDHYTCDVQGISNALDYIKRRMPREHSLSIIIDDLMCAPRNEAAEYHKLEDVLTQSGVTSITTIGETAAKYVATFAHPFKLILAKSPEEAVRLMSVNSLFNSTLYLVGNDKTRLTAMRDHLELNRHLTVLNINLDALSENFKRYKSMIPKSTGIVAMIKASAYGCGDVEVARTVQALGGDYLAVAVVDEGAKLRAAGVSMPILVLDPWCRNPHAIVYNGLEPTIIAPDENLLGLLDRTVAEMSYSEYPIHIKLDTGMHRVGLSEQQLPEFIEMLAKYPHLKVASLFSHLATADELTMNDYTQFQLDKFKRMTDYISSRLNYPVKKHILNTAGITRYGDKHHYDLVRLGIGLYGISPLDSADQAQLKCVASLKTTIIAVSSYGAGETVGYGRRGVLTRNSRIATLPIGYADGIDRHLGCGAASFLVRGKMCPTVGNICMDLTMIDITDCPEAQWGDSVEIFGANAPINRLSDTLHTIPYEILTSISPRIKRLYFRE